MAVAAIPYVVQPTFDWNGNDGNWSTFRVNVGTPQQSFEVLPSTCSNDIWIPGSGACSPYSFEDCASSRGILPFEGSQSQGFLSNLSTTWDQLGIYDLSLENGLFASDDSGLYGQDTVSLGGQNARNLTSQTVAAIATNDFWLGSLGLGIQASQFDVRQGSASTLLSSLYAANMTPSQSYGFAAGASYKSAAGGLVFGGYDLDAFTPSNISFPLQLNLSRSLTVSLRSVVTNGAPSGTRSLTTAPLNMSLDSTVAQIWLPSSVCDAFASNLSLTYDNTTGLYLVNSTVRDQLRQASPQFVFTVAANESTGQTTNIVLPYAAFDQEVGLPTYNTSTAYFPIRRGANETRFVLGRTFLQEAYVVVDWERQNFTLGQSLHRNGVSDNIMPILPPASNGSSRKGLGAGAIAGIVIGAVALAACIGLGIWLCLRRRRPAGEAPPPPEETVFRDEKKEPLMADGAAELSSPVAAPRSELMAKERHELHGDQLKCQLMSNPVYELPGATPELDSGEASREPVK